METTYIARNAHPDGNRATRRSGLRIRRQVGRGNGKQFHPTKQAVAARLFAKKTND